MDLNPIVTPHAPAPSSDDTGPTLERHVGELVAAVAAALAEGLRELQLGKLTDRTKAHGADLLVELFKFRQMMIADWPFDAICRQQGGAVLRESCGSEVSAGVIEELITGVLEMLAKVVRAAVN